MAFIPISERSLPVVAKAYEDEVDDDYDGADGQWGWNSDYDEDDLTTPTAVESFIRDSYGDLMEPRRRLSLISSKFNGRLTTQVMKNIWHWLKGADANVERSYKNTSGAPTMDAIYSQINEMLCIWAHTGERGTRHSAKAGPRA